MNSGRLERLVVNWRERAESQYSRPAKEALLDCADELAAALSSRNSRDATDETAGRLTVSTEEAAEVLGVGVKTVARWARESQDPEKDENRLPNAFKTSDSGVWRIPLADVRNVLHGGPNAESEEETEEGDVENIESLLDR